MLDKCDIPHDARRIAKNRADYYNGRRSMTERYLDSTANSNIKLASDRFLSRVKIVEFIFIGLLGIALKLVLVIFVSFHKQSSGYSSVMTVIEKLSLRVVFFFLRFYFY